jgi:precorrin-3B C17-methyltransferase
MEMLLSQSPDKKGALYIVGIGPGSPDMITKRASDAITESEIIIGNSFYLDQIEPFLIGKTVIRSSMGKEVERAKKCIEMAEHAIISMISGGDPGVYGMAGIVLEVLEHSDMSIRVEVIPGITAASAGASKLGSPLSSDFAVISLSDLLTPWNVIEKRLSTVFSIKIPVVLYNPKSRTRTEQFGEAIKIASRHLEPTTPVGIIKNAYREEEEVLITTLGDIINLEEQVDMHTVVFIGGEDTRIWRNGEDVRGIITPRGYHRKYVY